MRVFVTRRIPENGPEILSGAGLEIDVHDSEIAPSREELLAGIAGADAVITLMSDRVDEVFLDAAGDQLKVVANFAVGYDNVDVAACSQRGVAVANTPDVLTDTTADQALMLLLAVARRVRQGHELVASGQWRGWHPLQLLGLEVSGAKLGIVGMGRIGRAVARRGRGFGMRILYHNRSRKPEAEAELDAGYRDMPELLAESDFVSLHTPLNEDTRHIIDGKALERMGPASVLVNTGRGPLVDEAALVTALSNGTIWGAGLDVFEEEPHIAPGLAQLDNVVLAPHLGSATLATRREMARLCAQAVIDVLEGRRPPNQVNA